MRNPCCCMSLRTGALVVGALEVIVYGLTSLFMGFSLGQFVETRKNNETALAELWNKTLQETELHPDLHVDLDGVVLIMSLSIALSFVSCIVGIVCIVGVKKNSQALIKCWLLIRAMTFVFMVLLAIASLIHGRTDVKSFASDLISNGMGIYFWVIILAFYLELKKGGDGTYSTNKI